MLSPSTSNLQKGYYSSNYKHAYESVDNTDIFLAYKISC